MSITNLKIGAARDTIQAYVLGIERLATAFSTIEQEADEIEAEYENKMMDSPSEDEEDSGDYVREATDAWLRAYLPLDLAKQEHFNLAAVGLYHLWERPVRELFLWTVGKRLPKTVNILEHLNFNELASLLKEFGFDFESRPYFGEIEDLGLLSHVHKHGSGPSLKLLLKRRPNLFEEDIIGSPRPDHLVVSLDQLRDFAKALTDFWDDISVTL